MRLVYGTNFWSHHQAPVARELARLLGPDRFRLAVFEEVSPERRAMGWSEGKGLPWLIGPPTDEASRRGLYHECLAADVMVYGDCPPDVLRSRAEAGKLTLVASERILKKAMHRLRLLNPRYARGLARYRKLVNHQCVHALAVGHHAPADLRTIGACDDRIWRWGYFVEVPATLPEPRVQEAVKILWAGRMLGWKRIETLLRAMARLEGSPMIGECLLVGDGPEKARLRRLVLRLGLDRRVRFEPPVPFDAVRGLMRAADVYVLSSNRMEGWGAVAGEAMSEGCVLLANDSAGASQQLVVDGVSGLLFRDGDDVQLAAHLDLLSRDRELLDRMRQAAWGRMATIWSPRSAAERLVALCEGLLTGRPPEFVDGPCSRAS